MSVRCTLQDCARNLQAARRSKYNVRLDELGKLERTFRGRVYHSAAEAGYAAHLEALQRAGEIREWRPQVRVPIVVNGQGICVYVADFRVILADGAEELHEVKGAETQVWRLKRKLLEALYPDVRLVVVR